MSRIDGVTAWLIVLGLLATLAFVAQIAAISECVDAGGHVVGRACLRNGVPI